MGIVVRESTSGYISRKSTEGFWADSCGTGYLAQYSVTDGFLAITNRRAGFKSDSNDGGGFISARNTGHGFYSSNDTADGLRVERSGDHAAHLQNLPSSPHPAVFINHGNDAVTDLRLGGEGRLAADKSLTLSLDANGTEINENFTIQDDKGATLFQTGEIGLTTINTLVAVVGDVAVTGDVCANNVSCSSDRRFKRNVHSIGDAVAKISNIRGVTYDWDRDAWPDRQFSEGRQIGFIAQELEKVFPELVHTDEQGFKSVSYDKMTAILVEAVKELKAENEALRTGGIDSLKAQIEVLTARLDVIDGRM